MFEKEMKEKMKQKEIRLLTALLSRHREYIFLPLSPETGVPHWLWNKYGKRLACEEEVTAILHSLRSSA